MKKAERKYKINVCKNDKYFLFNISFLQLCYREGKKEKKILLRENIYIYVFLYKILGWSNRIQEKVTFLVNES